MVPGTPGWQNWRGAAVKTLIIDNYDSYTYNLFQLISEVNGEEAVVVRNDAATWEELSRRRFDNVVISPGPGTPERPGDFGICADALATPDLPILGVCLGHQGLAHVNGGAVVRDAGRGPRADQRRCSTTSRRCSPGSRRASGRSATTR